MLCGMSGGWCGKVIGILFIFLGGVVKVGVIFFVVFLILFVIFGVFVKVIFESVISIIVRNFFINYFIIIL